MAGEECDHQGAIDWNPLNNAEQCHRCGQVISFIRHARLPDDTPPDASMWDILSRIKLDMPEGE